MEEPAFDALQRKDRQESGDSDDDGVEDRTLYFMRGKADPFGGGLGAVGMTQMAHDVFDQYDGAFDHHAKVQCTQGKQIGWNLHQVQAGSGKQQGKRNRGGDDDRAADIPQK